MESSQTQQNLYNVYEAYPYQGQVPFTFSFRQDPDRLFPYAAAIPFYLRDRRVPAGPLDILDVGCGAGVTTLLLAEANPGAHLTAIDLSVRSAQLTAERLQFQGYTADCRGMAAEDLPQLGKQFDYINCHEVLYLLPDPWAGLQQMAAVLKPGGIIRANLHSANARVVFFRSQELMRMLGLMESAPSEFEHQVVREWMGALKNDTFMKKAIWQDKYRDDAEFLNSNFLLQGDKGFSIPDLFSMLESAGLYFLGMVDSRSWNLLDLFAKPDELPDTVRLFLEEASDMEQLHAHDLLVASHRLFDFWCSAQPTRELDLPGTWKESQWAQAQAILNPILKVERLETSLRECLQEYEPLLINPLLPQTTAKPVYLTRPAQLCLRFLWEESLLVPELIARVLPLLPPDPWTGQPLSQEQGVAQVRQALVQMEVILAVFLAV
ncbi:MAG TPA: SAM-dependent methyltransferase [Cyanobacteria bacterium UBA8156]|jgi:SAM-dependent methyltransferase|nr:SAM-dependent methyltransferase [Cyanobacteria bacterium UBA8156]